MGETETQRDEETTNIGFYGEELVVVVDDADTTTPTRTTADEGREENMLPEHAFLANRPCESIPEPMGPTLLHVLTNPSQAHSRMREEVNTPCFLYYSAVRAIDEFFPVISKPKIQSMLLSARTLSTTRYSIQNMNLTTLYFSFILSFYSSLRTCEANPNGDIWVGKWNEPPRMYVYISLHTSNTCEISRRNHETAHASICALEQDLCKRRS